MTAILVDQLIGHLLITVKKRAVDEVAVGDNSFRLIPQGTNSSVLRNESG